MSEYIWQNPTTSVAKTIIDTVVLALQRKLGMKETNCYPSAVIDYIEGSDRLVIQIVPAGESPEGDGKGSQGGGTGVVKRLSWHVHIFLTLNLDPYHRSRQLLLNEFEGIMSLQNRISNVFAQTSLGVPAGDTIHYLLAGRMQWEKTDAVTWFDYDRGIAESDMTFSGVYGQLLPHEATLLPSDLV